MIVAVVTFSLTLVSITVTKQSSLREGRGAEAHRVMGVGAVPAGGFAGCSRADSESTFLVFPGDCRRLILVRFSCGLGGL
jgi:hypothetical protein